MTQTPEKRLFVFGYGYTAAFLGLALQEKGWRIAGTTRDPEKYRTMREHGVESFLFDEDSSLPDPFRALQGTTHILFSIPPNDAGDPAFLAHMDDVLRIPGLEWAGYLSTTGAYGNRDGGWVDETSEVRPDTRRGVKRVRAEDQFLSAWRAQGFPVHIFRLAGIYGPGRSALDSVRAGNTRRIEKPGFAFNRMHIADIVQTLLASIDRPNPGQTYNLSDDRPAPSHELISTACEMMGITPLPLTPFDLADLSPIARSFYADNKRVRNDRIKTELGVTLLYPDFIKGLQACLDAEQNEPDLITRWTTKGNAEG